jgi:LPXTG-motif cell wall-anchored protein
VNRTSLMRRLLFCAAGVTVGFAAALAVASPASAHEPLIDREVVCDPETGGRLVTWTITSNAPADVETWKLNSAVADPPDLTLIGIELGVIQSVDEPFVAELFIGSGVTDSAGIAVEAEWDNGVKATASDEVAFEGTCEPGEEEEFVANFDCETVSMTIPNPFEEETTFEVVPSEGEPVTVTLGPDEVSEGAITFPIFAGLTIDILVDGESILEGGPFEFTDEDLEGLDCEEEPSPPPPPAPGEGGGLPQTGNTSLLIAGGAGALLLLGAGLFLIARRRRLTFTA